MKKLLAILAMALFAVPGWAQSDQELAALLDGLIAKNRGLREDPNRQAITSLSKNEILKKLRIALNLRDDQMLTILAAGGSRLSKSELSAFFRKPTSSNNTESGTPVHSAQEAMPLK